MKIYPVTTCHISSELREQLNKTMDRNILKKMQNELEFIAHWVTRENYFLQEEIIQSMTASLPSL